MLEGYLLDAYRSNNKVILWVKKGSKNFKVERRFNVSLYVKANAEKLIQNLNLSYLKSKKKTYYGKYIDVLKIDIQNIASYNKTVKIIEKASKHRAELYNADIPPEQQLLYQYDVKPGDLVQISQSNIKVKDARMPFTLSKCTVNVLFIKDQIKKLKINGAQLFGTEDQKLKSFQKIFQQENPDVVILNRAFYHLPKIVERMNFYNIKNSFHRFDSTKIKSNGGRSFYSYGKVMFKDFAIRLRGRFLIDSHSTVGADCDIDGILELCNLTGARFQHLASRSFGAASQHSLIRLLYQEGYLIPYKEKPVDIPITLNALLKADRAGHRFDPKQGLHKNVAEIDFSSMFPWIIYHKNISAECFFSKSKPLEKVPNLPLTISHATKGIVPRAIKPLIDARMKYKQEKNPLFNSRNKALKMVLVTAYGYLRFREFKLGLASCHMAICAYARDIILRAAHLAESHGFEVIHGIVDSLYLTKPNLTKNDVEILCKDIKQAFNIPISIEGIFRWVTFLPSVNDKDRPLPATYYGVDYSGNVKVRGIEVRQRKPPLIVKMFQEKMIEEIVQYNSVNQIKKNFPRFCRTLKVTINGLSELQERYFLHTVQISKLEYKHEIAQKQVVRKLQARNQEIHPGSYIQYAVCEKAKIMLADEFTKPDISYYSKLLIRSLFIILQPFAITKEHIQEYIKVSRQTTLCQYVQGGHSLCVADIHLQQSVES
jgi:DNA polymerase elongation subunit (family B)